MNNTSKRAGVVVAALSAAGLVGACPGTAFADSHRPAPIDGVSLSATVVTHHAGPGHLDPVQHPDRSRLILDRGPVRRPDDDQRHTRAVRESQTGTVSSVLAGGVVVTGADGMTWTWIAGPATTVRVAGAPGTLADVRAGDRVLITGVQTGPFRHAELVADAGHPQIQRQHDRPRHFGGPAGPRGAHGR
jgi:hypothetical protein